MPSHVVITRSDSGRAGVNYSEPVGGSAAAAISTHSYHPQRERGFENDMGVWGTQMT